LAVANQGDNTVTILFGDGKGNFLAPATGPTSNGVFPAGSNPSAIVAGDFNKDGKLDLAVANVNGNNITILLGNGAGAFTPGATPTVGNGPSSLAVADFDGDGNLDLAATNLDDGTLTILFGDGTGAFPRHVTLTSGKYPIAMVAADLNGDGVPDLAIVNEGDGTVTVFTGPI